MHTYKYLKEVEKDLYHNWSLNSPARQGYKFKRLFPGMGTTLNCSSVCFIAIDFDYQLNSMTILLKISHT